MTNNENAVLQVIIVVLLVTLACFSIPTLYRLWDLLDTSDFAFGVVIGILIVGLSAVVFRLETRRDRR